MNLICDAFRVCGLFEKAFFINVFVLKCSSNIKLFNITVQDKSNGKNCFLKHGFDNSSKNFVVIKAFSYSNS